jgi:TRAP-type mannitol/chloroaromatic compound transport system substrate-binding protein
MTKKRLLAILASFIIACFLISTAGLAAADEKETLKDFGVDKRHMQWKGKKWTTSEKKIRWRMVEPWSAGNLLHNWPQHFCDGVRAASGGRLDIKLYPAGALVPGMEVFDAVSEGTAECGHSVAGFWKGKEEALVAFWSIPYGLDAEMTALWFYERGGLEMLQEIYAKHNIMAFPLGNAGQENGFFSNRRATKMEDYKGMKVRTMGYYADIMNLVGASANVLPPTEIYLGLERGIVDAAEFSGPAANIPMGLHEISKYVLQPGIHQPGAQTELIINKKSWNALPDDLKAIVEICARETDAWANIWMEALNARAMNYLKEHIEVVKMDDETLVEFCKMTHKYLEEKKAKYPLLKKALDSQEKLRKEFECWRDARGRVVPWPYETYISGKLSE